MPTVSIIIPAYNSSPYIEGALESVFAQTFTDYEIIVVNDGAPDTEELERVLAPYRDKIVYIQQRNTGTGGARNTAIRVARGRYVALLDADDRFAPEYLRVQVEILESDPTIDVLYPDAFIFGSGRWTAGKRFMDATPSEGPVNFESLVEERCTVYIGVTAKRDVLLRVGLFDEDQTVIEDLDLWFRVVKLGGRIAYHRQVLAYYCVREDAQSADLVRMCERQVAAIEKAGRTLPLTTAEREAMKRSLAHYRADLDINLAKRALRNRQFDAVARHLNDSNTYFRSRKVALLSWLASVAPRLLLSAYTLRELVDARRYRAALRID